MSLTVNDKIVYPSRCTTADIFAGLRRVLGSVPESVLSPVNATANFRHIVPIDPESFANLSVGDYPVKGSNRSDVLSRQLTVLPPVMASKQRVNMIRIDTVKPHALMVEFMPIRNRPIDLLPKILIDQGALAVDVASRIACFIQRAKPIPTSGFGVDGVVIFDPGWLPYTPDNSVCTIPCQPNPKRALSAMAMFLATDRNAALRTMDRDTFGERHWSPPNRTKVSPFRGRCAGVARFCIGGIIAC